VLTAGERSEVTLALRLVGDAVEQQDVALVGCGAVHRERTEQAATGLAEDHRLSDVVQRVPAVRRRRGGREHAGRSCGILQLAAQLLVGPAMIADHGGLGRASDLVDEGANALPQLLDLGSGGEIHHRTRATGRSSRRPPRARSP
jgi:hypothetical protein